MWKERWLFEASWVAVSFRSRRGKLDGGHNSVALSKSTRSQFASAINSSGFPKAARPSRPEDALAILAIAVRYDTLFETMVAKE